MKTAIIVHGKPNQAKYQSSDTDPSDSHWIPWVKHRMNLADVCTFAPDMPKPYAPDYHAWEEEFDRYKPWQPQTSLIGLSAGAGFILRYASEWNKLHFDKLVLVAPWLDPNRNYGDFGEFEIDQSLPERCIGGIAVFYSSIDDEQAQASLAVVQEQLPAAKYIDIPKYGHFMLGNTMESPEFPELLNEVL